MIDPWFAILAALIILMGNGAYAVDTVRGKTQPNRELDAGRWRR